MILYLMPPGRLKATTLGTHVFASLALDDLNRRPVIIGIVRKHFGSNAFHKRIVAMLGASRVHIVRISYETYIY